MGTRLFDLDEFILKGTIGCLQKGSNAEEIVELLGKPEDIGNATHGIKIFSYASRRFQVTTYHDTLSLICMYYWNAKSSILPKWLSSFRRFNESTTQEEFEDYLKIRFINYNINAVWSFDVTTALDVGENTKAFFREGKLDSLQADYSDR